MRRMLLLPLALLATLVVVASGAAATKTVQITKSGFTPTATTIPPFARTISIVS